MQFRIVLNSSPARPVYQGHRIGALHNKCKEKATLSPPAEVELAARGRCRTSILEEIEIMPAADTENHNRRILPVIVLKR